MIPVELCAFQANLAGLLGQALSNVSGVTFTGIVHTSDWALSLALGPGAERFSGLRRNTEAFEIIAELLGIEHRNPRMTPEEAMKVSMARRVKLGAAGAWGLQEETFEKVLKM